MSQNSFSGLQLINKNKAKLIEKFSELFSSTLLQKLAALQLFHSYN